MDIVRFMAGLGNQMFQYGLLKALSMRGREVVGDLNSYKKCPQVPFCLNTVFKNVSFEVADIDEAVIEQILAMWKVIIRNEKELNAYLATDYSERFFLIENGGRYDEHIFDTRDCIFIGYWQTEKYFVQIRQTLLHDFQFQEGETKLVMWKERLLNSNCYVSVHVRRGDYLKTPQVFGGICTDEYYAAALRLMEEHIENPIFVFFSDDIVWVKEHYKYDNAIYIMSDMFEDYQEWYDMCLMSCCSHNIIANSSFSWWGAWLNQRPERVVIAPEPWFNTKEMAEICPESWIRLDAKKAYQINNKFIEED